MRYGALLFALCVAGCAAWLGPRDGSPHGQGVPFEAFLTQLETEATARGLPAELLRASYRGAPPAPLPMLRVAEQNQAEFTDTLANYTARAVSPARVAQGRALLAEHRDVLRPLERRYGVPAPVLVALWGMESDFGRNAGNLPLLPSLISMAYKSPRHDMFRREVFAALQIPAKTGQALGGLKGSWAGATGQCQFMPSNVLKYATDGNGDGRIDLWHTPADALASTAKFMRALGYQPGQPWRWAVNKPLNLAGIEMNVRGLSVPLTQAEWAKRGLHSVRFSGKSKLRYYRPEGEAQAYLVGPNYEAVLGWNYSSYFATSVFLLADQLAKKDK